METPVLESLFSQKTSELLLLKCFPDAAAPKMLQFPKITSKIRSFFGEVSNLHSDLHSDTSPFHAYCLKMTKQTLKILRFPHRKIFKVCLAIFQHYQGQVYIAK